MPMKIPLKHLALPSIQRFSAAFSYLILALITTSIIVAHIVQAEEAVLAPETYNIVTVAGNGIDIGDGRPATDALLGLPFGLTFDTSGNLYIADRDSHRVRKVSAATGIITTVAGTGVAGFSGDNGLATAAQLNVPFD